MDKLVRKEDALPQDSSLPHPPVSPLVIHEIGVRVLIRIVYSLPRDGVIACPNPATAEGIKLAP